MLLPSSIRIIHESGAHRAPKTIHFLWGLSGINASSIQFCNNTNEELRHHPDVRPLPCQELTINRVQVIGCTRKPSEVQLSLQGSKQHIFHVS
ncbi:hypothetical protein CKAN_01892900 [Cinnamomum micranthum f. kanehirae]|uniref:Uncharacterized protein n=1 Tax=Cinnamomum micranthum f. kanehirae TaxID=337451 RepID=A0A3S3PG22_9MAGN|nr:hypothetical protein CKAN_01892900 [Cinnamomum micranthum f. kanehirae]